MINNLKWIPGSSAGKESTCQCRRHKRHGFNLWLRKILWSRKWQPNLEFLPGKIPWTEESGRVQSMGSQIVRHNWACIGMHAHMHRFTFQPAVHKDSLFSTSLLALVNSLSFVNSHSNRWEVISYFGFNLYFPDN